MKTAHIAIGVFLILAIAAIAILYSAVLQKQSGVIVFYYGNTCPHCQVVETFIDDNNLNATLKLDYREVFNNSDNAATLQGIWVKCNQTGDPQVPLLYYNNSCFIGEDQAISFLNSHMGAKQ